MIYLIYRDGAVLYPTTLPRIVMDAFKDGSVRVELWRTEKLVRTFKSAKEFNRFVNPPRGEDEEPVNSDYEW